ncbi:MAG: hypothetical protein AAGA78_20010 [Pseudomonadota bacterium]
MLQGLLSHAQAKSKIRPFPVLAFLAAPFVGTLALTVAGVVVLGVCSAIFEQGSIWFEAGILTALFSIPGGAPFYLLQGGSVFYLAWRLGARGPLIFAVLGGVANVATPVFAQGFIGVWTMWSATAEDPWLWWFTVPYAIAWGAAFGWLSQCWAQRGEPVP